MAKAYSPLCLPGVRARSVPPVFGRCPACDSHWDKMVEEVVEPEVSHSARAVRGLNASSQPRRLAEIEGEHEERVPVRMQEFARGKLGGGTVPGSVC